MNKKLIANGILVLSVVIVILSLQTSYAFSTDEVPQSETEVKTQLCLVLDGSDSIRSTEWSTIKQGIAEAINTTIPRDGSVELAIVQFGYPADEGYAKTEIPPVVINSTNHATIANQVLTILQGGIGTSMPHGLYLGWQEIHNSPHFETAQYQIINLATDGEPNRRNDNATTDLDGNGQIDCWDDVIAVVNNAVNLGLEELDIEGIGITNSSRDWFKNWVVHPQPGTLAPPFSKPGWIRVVANAAEFANTIDQKLQLVVFPEATYILTIDIAGNGSVVKVPDQATYTYGMTVEVTAIPDSCYRFDHWELDSVNVGSANPYTVAVDGNHTLHSVFVQIEYTLMVNVVGGGSVTKNPDLATYPCGTVAILTTVPDSGWFFSHWSGDPLDSTVPDTVTMSSDKNVTAHFTKDQIWAPSLQDAAAGGIATVAMTSTLAAMSSSLTSPAASVGSSFWSKIVAALPDSLQNLLQSYGEEILASKTQKEVEARECSRLTIAPAEVLAFVLGAVTLTFCFSYAIAGATPEIVSVVPIVFLTVVVAELVYWLTMELVARRIGIWSEYRVWPIGITMLLVFSLIFRSPFCVAGRSEFQCATPKKRSIGLISLSGPVACLLLGGIFALLLVFGYEQLGSLGVMVCMTKATFDLIPTPPMNGKEIFNWNKIIWLLLFVPSVASYLFFILSF